LIADKIWLSAYLADVPLFICGKFNPVEYAS